jgi:hypothetical protein
MLLIITTGIAVIFLFVLVALYIIFRVDIWDRLSIRQLEFSSPAGEPFYDGDFHDSRSADARVVKANHRGLPFEISDNGGRRSGIDRRQFSPVCRVPTRWTGPDRRHSGDRRSGLDRRGGIKFRQAGEERRDAFC